MRARNSQWSKIVVGVVMVLVTLAVVRAQSTGTWALRFSTDAQGAAGPEVEFAYAEMSFEAALNWSGPRSTASGIQTAVYQGNSARCGWGLMVAAGNPGFLNVGAPAGSVGILVGGNAILFSPDTLLTGTWQTVRASFVVMGDQGFYRVQVGNSIPHDLPGPAANPTFACTDRWMQIGSGSDLFNLGAPSPDPFNGMIDSATVTNMVTSLAHHFQLEEGTGAAQTADEHGHTMTLYGGPEWVRLQQPHCTIEELIARVRSFNLKNGLENSLDAKLQNALKAINKPNGGDRPTACNLLGAFIAEVSAQRGKGITSAQADELISCANEIRASLGCR